MSPQQREFESKWTGRAAPDFKLKDLAGKDVQLAAYRGRPVVLTFFGYG
jgi:peroxiredoxin